MHDLALTNDVIFKLVFGAEKHEAILRGLLNAILGLSGPQRISQIKVLNPNLDKINVSHKGCILDIKAQDIRGRRFNVEVQVSREPDYINRSLYYLTRLFSEQLNQGEGYDEICQTVGLSFLDFTLFPDEPTLHNTFRMCNLISKHTLTDILELHYIELSKFQQNQPQQLQTRFERWLHLLKFGELYLDQSLPVPNNLNQDKEITMALKAYRQVSASEEVHQILEDRMKARRDEATRLSRARKEGLAEGELKGKLEGLAEGKLEGLAEGKLKGLAEGKLKAAEAMLAAGINSSEVCKILDLKPEQLTD